MPDFALTPELLAGIAGAVLSILFAYIPGLNTWYARFIPEIKRSIMLVLLILSGAAIYAMGCAGWMDTGISCDQAGVLRLVWILITAVMSNQSTYMIIPKTDTVKIAQQESRENDYERLNHLMG